MITGSASTLQLFQRLSPLQLPPQASALCERHTLRAGSSHPHEKPETSKDIKKKSGEVKKESTADSMELGKHLVLLREKYQATV